MTIFVQQYWLYSICFEQSFNIKGRTPVLVLFWRGRLLARQLPLTLPSTRSVVLKITFFFIIESFFINTIRNLGHNMCKKVQVWYYAWKQNVQTNGGGKGERGPSRTVLLLVLSVRIEAPVRTLNVVPDVLALLRVCAVFELAGAFWSFDCCCFSFGAPAM